MRNEELCRSSFGDCLARNTPRRIKKSNIKSMNDFLNCFWQVGQLSGEKKVVLFVDEYDILESADDVVKSSFLKVVRGIKATKDDYSI